MTGNQNGAAPGGLNGLASDGALRDLIREVLRDVLPTLANPAGGGGISRPTGTLSPADPVSPAGPPGSFTRSERADSPGRATAPPASPPSSMPAGPATAAQPEGAPAGQPTAADDGAGVRAVRLTSDEELREFVLQIVRLADNPKRRRDLLAGRLRFTLAGAGPAPGPAVTHRVDKGAVTERAVIAAARAGAGLVLGPRAVLTPLARDKARALGVRVEKER